MYEMVGAVTPFFAEDASDIYELVLGHVDVDDLEFPPDVAFSPESKDLIKQLMHPKKQKRLGIMHPGIKAIKEHAFFKKARFDWEALAKQTMKPVIMPSIVDMSKYASGNSITYDPKLNNTPDDNSGWKLNW